MFWAILDIGFKAGFLKGIYWIFTSVSNTNYFKLLCQFHQSYYLIHEQAVCTHRVSFLGKCIYLILTNEMVYFTCRTFFIRKQ